MADTTVGQLAKLIKIDEKILLKKLMDSGIRKTDSSEIISNEEKNTLLMFIQSEKKTQKSFALRHKTVNQLRTSSNKKVNVEVRTKKIFSLPGKEMKKSFETNIKKNLAERNLFQNFNINKEKTVDGIKKVNVKQEISTNSVPTKNKKTFVKKQDSGFRIVSRPNIIPKVNALIKDKEDVLKTSIISNPKSRDRFSNKKPIDGARDNHKRNKKYSKDQKKIIKTISDNYEEIETRYRRKNKKSDLNQNKKIKINNPKKIVIYEEILISELAQKMSVKSEEIIKLLSGMGMKVTLSAKLDTEIAMLIVEEFGNTYVLHKDDLLIKNMSSSVNSDSQNSYHKETRPPVVTIMGHVDHGKTSLLDYIRKTHMVKNEYGGITQHIGAYSVKTTNGLITFLDTPGHEAFSAMRARGANITDIIVLVVAIDDGVKPQTIESIQHAKSSNVPIIVAINKVDKIEFHLDKIRLELSKHGIISDKQGGEVMFVGVSAKSGLGVNELLNNISLQAELLELKSTFSGSAKGIVIESKLQKGRGVVVSLLVKMGLLEKGDIVVCGTEYTKIRTIFDCQGKEILSAVPSTPVEILGFSTISLPGDEVTVVQNEKIAKQISELRKNKLKDKNILDKQGNDSTIFDLIKKKIVKEETEKNIQINVIIKSDFQGSLEAINYALSNIDSISLNIVAKGVGDITSSDINLAISMKCIIFGFNVHTDFLAKKISSSKKVDIRHYEVIYDIISDVKKMIAPLSNSLKEEKIVGSVEVRNIFNSSKHGLIVGCMTLDGSIKRQNPIRIIRDGKIIHSAKLRSLKRFKDNVSEVKKGLECGLVIDGYNDIKINDKIESFEIVSL